MDYEKISRLIILVCTIILAISAFFYANETYGYCDKFCQVQDYSYGEYSFYNAECTCIYDASNEHVYNYDNENDILDNFINISALSANYESEI